MKKPILAIGTAALVALQLVSSASAWGPERPTYTNKNPADHPVFNSITDNAAVGDERDFVRIGDKGTNDQYENEIEVEGGKQYEVYIYYHNNASGTYNDQAHNYAGIARDVRVATGFPKKLEAGQRAAVSAKIMSSNASPATVWDEAYITAKEAVTLSYVEGSAKVFNLMGSSGSVLPMSLFTDKGALLGMDVLDGTINGCAEYSGQVIYLIKAEAVNKPEPEPEPEPEPKPEEPEPTPEEPEPTPEEPEPTPEEPETPQQPEEKPIELPTTGPAEVVLAVVVVLAIAAGGFYWYRTQKAVKKVTKKAKGKK